MGDLRSNAFIELSIQDMNKKIEIMEKRFERIRKDHPEKSEKVNKLVTIAWHKIMAVEQRVSEIYDECMLLASVDESSTATAGTIKENGSQKAKDAGRNLPAQGEGHGNNDDKVAKPKRRKKKKKAKKNPDAATMDSAETNNSPAQHVNAPKASNSTTEESKEEDSSKILAIEENIDVASTGSKRDAKAPVQPSPSPSEGSESEEAAKQTLKEIVREKSAEKGKLSIFTVSGKIAKGSNRKPKSSSSAKTRLESNGKKACEEKHSVKGKHALDKSDEN